jgi:hypothetical protein
MANQKYTYSIQDDFPNHLVATDRLLQEIAASAIVTALDRIDTAGDDCDVWFKAALSQGDETILDGLVAAHSGTPLPAVAQPVSLDQTVQIHGTVEQTPLEGRRYDVYTTDFTKKETWYQDSARVTGETLTDSGNHTTYTSLVSRFWIDVMHGKIFRERDYRETYAPVVKVDNVAKTEHPAGTTSGDYSVNYTTGAVTFKTALVGTEVVTADYSYARTSLFKAAAPTGYVWTSNVVKVMYSKDMGMKDTIIFQLWGNIGAGMQPLSSPEYYQTLDDLKKDASRSEREATADTSAGDTWRMPTQPRCTLFYDYSGRAATSLQGAYAMEIRCWLENDIPFVGEMGCASFFGRKDEE